MSAMHQLSAMHGSAIRSGDANAFDCADVVRIRSTVIYEELPAGPRRRVTVVEPRASDASIGRISVLSPIGRALLGRRRNQIAEVGLPMGRSIAIRVADVEAPVSVEVDELVYA